MQSSVLYYLEGGVTDLDLSKLDIYCEDKDTNVSFVEAVVQAPVKGTKIYTSEADLLQYGITL